MNTPQILSFVALMAGASLAAAQNALPAAPDPQVISAHSPTDFEGTLALAQSAPAAGPAQSAPSDQATAASGQAAQPPDLTLAQAEQLAIRNNPRVTVGKLLALAQHQVYREARAAELPDATFNASAVNSVEASRIGAPGPDVLTSSRLLEHAGAGINVNQLIYDFGHTRNLVLAQKLSEKASDANALASSEEIVLAADQAFFDALIAQAELDVARQTVATRQTTDMQVGEMTRNKLKSTLDLSFADVDLSQAQLLQIDAQSNSDASMAALDAVLGLDHSVTYHLVEDTGAPPPPPADVAPLIQTALQQRPDLQALSYDTQSAQKYARAQWDQLLPSVSASGTVGVLPVDPSSYYIDNWWGAYGGTVSVPVFNGFLYISQAREAKYREQAASENARDLRDRIVRDVRTSWLQAGNNWQRMSVTAQLVKQANLALALAQTRYKLGLSSIVELSQAQLQQTSAQIQDTSARYQYRLSLSTLNYEMGVAR
jgi:outer membrane protein